VTRARALKDSSIVCEQSARGQRKPAAPPIYGKMAGKVTGAQSQRDPADDPLIEILTRMVRIIIEFETAGTDEGQGLEASLENRQGDEH
jgi:hypothetical protein